MRSPRRRWIVGRDLCLYRCEDFDNVPRGRRRAALELNIPVWSPFARTGHHCVWAGAAAMVWMWDAEQVGQGGAQGRREEEAPHGRPAPRAAQWLPETVLHPKKADGVHLQACQRGFEFQHWRGGVLRASYWQQPEPDQAAWGWFAGRVDAPAEQAAPTASPAQFAAPPWATPVTPGDWLRARERQLVAGGFALFALAACWQEARIWTFAARAAAAAEDVRERQDELEPLLRARNEVRRLRVRNGALAALFSAPSQPELMILADRAVPDGVAFHQWRYQTGDLALALTGEQLDPVACVEGLSRVFDEVALGGRQQPGRVDIALKVRPAPRSGS